MFILLQKHAFRNIFRSLNRTLTIVFTIAVCTVVIILIGGFYDYLFKSTEKEVITEEGHITFTSSSGGNYIKDYPALKKIITGHPGVFMATATLTVNGIAGYEEKSVLFHGVGENYKERAMIREFVYKTGSPGADETADGVELGSILAENLGAGKGAIVNLLVIFDDYMTGFSLTVKDVVTTVSEKLDRVYIKMPLTVLQESLGISGVDKISVVVKDPRRCEQIKDELLKAAAAGGWSLKAELYNNSGSYLRSVVDIYMNNYYFILIVIVITVFFTISNIITMAIMERTKELGTIRSFGMRKTHLVALFASEGFYIGLMGSLAGTLLSIIVIMIINQLGGIYVPPQPGDENGFNALFNISASAIGLAVGISVVISLIASLLATIKLNFMTIIEELQYV